MTTCISSEADDHNNFGEDSYDSPEPYIYKLNDNQLGQCSCGSPADYAYVSWYSDVTSDPMDICGKCAKKTYPEEWADRRE